MKIKENITLGPPMFGHKRGENFKKQWKFEIGLK